MVVYEFIINTLYYYYYVYYCKLRLGTYKIILNCEYKYLANNAMSRLSKCKKYFKEENNINNFFYYYSSNFIKNLTQYLFG